MADSNPKRSKDELKAPDKEYRKIDLLSNYYHAVLAVYGSIISAALIGLLLVLATAFIENKIDLLAYYVGVAIVGAFLIGSVWNFLLRTYRPRMDEISDLLEKVSKGEELPPLRTLIRRKEMKVALEQSSKPSPEESKKSPSN